MQQGTKAISERQKLIRLADRSEYGWQLVEAYQRDELADNEKDAKKIEEAEKAVELKNRRKRKQASEKDKMEFQPPTSFRPPQYMGSFGFPPPPPPFIPPPISQAVPFPRPVGPAAKVPGPCFHCLQMGHLKAQCPNKISKPYPFNDVLVSGVSVQVSANNDCAEVCSTSQCVDKHQSGQIFKTDHSKTSSKRAQVLDVQVEDTMKYQGSREGPSSSSFNNPGIVFNGADDPDPTELQRYWELEESATQIQDVQGRLKDKLCFWKEVLHAPDPIIDCISEGYKLPLLSSPPTFFSKNQSSACQNADFVSSAITELLQNRCVQKIAYKPHICSPLSVVSNNAGKLRLVLNLRYLNQFLLKEKFKYEDLRVAMLMFQPGDYMFTFDLKSGYHHVDIHREHWKYLGFAWGEGPTLQCYVFCVLPFGLATACYLFTKLLRPLVKYWRSQGLRIVVYLDDGIAAMEGELGARKASLVIREDLTKAGFVVNMAKCIWTPSQQCSWLGFDIDLHQGKIAVPQEKIDTLKLQLQQAAGKPRLTAKSLASLTGKIIAMAIALGPVARLMTRELYALLNTRQSWCDTLLITDEVKSEIHFWLTEIAKFNGQNIWVGPSALRVVYTDASQTGYAGYTVQHGCHIAQGLWLPNEASKSSTWREIRAVRQVLEALESKLANQRVRWFTDNQNVVRILQVGSRKPDLQGEALAIFSISLSQHIHLEPEWIPRKNNELADYLSRIVDYDDWSLSRGTFRELDKVWGPHTVDRFASHYNTQLPRFNSRFWNPGSEAVDAFTVDWRDENNWLCPPVYLVPRVVQHARMCKAKGTLVVPEWPSAPFWPILFPEKVKFAPFVVLVRVLTAAEFSIYPGRLGSSLFKGTPNTNMLAIRLQF